ncbi:T9SS type A sorting domain-containing protein [Flavobacterium agrisoli]|uniref:Secretion protein n=1 Tax=Flavobacterium agrisoli TaxID=2793066 RepID=A0A934PLT0_9FLAO|nr:T9SS type A sorting domain-containing protein [Flavobacterium agrisoli]MBK0369184.1 secretion protein [Flavobacterium agrisoli]
MKTILKLSLVCALLFTGVNSYAVDGNGSIDFKLHVIKKEGSQVTFSLNRVKQAKLSIYDKEGNLIYSENAKGTEEGILRTFNFKEFPAGGYVLEIENENKKVIHEITVADNATYLSQAAISEVYKDNFNSNITTVASR